MRLPAAIGQGRQLARVSIAGARAHRASPLAVARRARRMRVQGGFEYDEAKGWPEDGIAPGTRWDDIPDDWSCPDCGAAKTDFDMFGEERLLQVLKDNARKGPEAVLEAVRRELFAFTQTPKLKDDLTLLGGGKTRRGVGPALRPANRVVAGVGRGDAGCPFGVEEVVVAADHGDGGTERGVVGDIPRTVDIHLAVQ